MPCPIQQRPWQLGGSQIDGPDGLSSYSVVSESWPVLPDRADASSRHLHGHCPRCHVCVLTSFSRSQHQGKRNVCFCRHLQRHLWVHLGADTVATSCGSIPSAGRAKGMALSTCSNWIFNFLIGMSSPDAFAGIHGYYYVIIAGFCLFSTGLVYFYYVETANHTLEEISLAFGDKAFVDDDAEVVLASNSRQAA